MRTTCSLFLALGLSWCHAGQASAQSADTTPLQRLSGLFMPKSKAAAANKETAPPPELVQQPAPAQQPTPVPMPLQAQPVVKTESPAAVGARESRGIVYMEAPNAPGKNVAPMSKASLTLPQQPARTTAAPVASSSPPIKNVTPAVATPRTVLATTNDPISRRLTSQISQACPQARNVRVALGSDKELTVEMDVRMAEDCNALAGAIFGIRDLDPYRVNLKFNVPQQ